ncbi:hypothetical protein [Bacteroides sp.]
MVNITAIQFLSIVYTDAKIGNESESLLMVGDLIAKTAVKDTKLKVNHSKYMGSKDTFAIVSTNAKILI